MEQVQVDAQRVHADPLDAGLGQAAGGVAAGGHHMVEALVGLGPEVEGRLLGPVAQVQGGERRRVGVADADHRHAQGLAGLQGRVAGHEDVAGLDDVGVEQLQHRGPLVGAGRHPVAVAERQLGGRDGVEARAPPPGSPRPAPPGCGGCPGGCLPARCAWRSGSASPRRSGARTSWWCRSGGSRAAARRRRSEAQAGVRTHQALGLVRGDVEHAFSPSILEPRARPPGSSATNSAAVRSRRRLAQIGRAARRFFPKPGQGTCAFCFDAQA